MKLPWYVRLDRAMHKSAGGEHVARLFTHMFGAFGFSIVMSVMRLQGDAFSVFVAAVLSGLLLQKTWDIFTDALRRQTDKFLNQGTRDD